MTLDYAVERLYETGWSAEGEHELETLEDGRKFPSVSSVQKQFAQAGLKLSIKQNIMFNCYHAAWSGGDSSTRQRGTVIGASESEAAVYALAQLRQTMGMNAVASQYAGLALAH